MCCSPMGLEGNRMMDGTGRVYRGSGEFGIPHYVVLFLAALGLILIVQAIL